MNLTGLFQLAGMGENVGEDLWKYVSPGGKSIESAFTWMLPFALKKQSWPYKQIKPAHYEEFAELARMAKTKYPDIDINGLPQSDNSLEHSILLLTNGIF